MFIYPRLKQWTLDSIALKLEKKYLPALEKEGIQYSKIAVMQFRRTWLDGLITLTQENLYFHSRKRFQDQNVVQISLDQIRKAELFACKNGNLGIKTTSDEFLFTVEEADALKAEVDKLIVA